MKNLKVTTTILSLAFLVFTAVSCKESKKEENLEAMYSENVIDMNNDAMNSNDNEIIGLYLEVKDDLVAEDSKAAAEVSKKLVTALEQMDISKYTTEQQTNLKNIVNEAKEHAIQIGKSEIEKQREHFKLLSNNMIDFVTITGTESTLYQQYCPMYDKGSSWLSKSKDIKNPYYGSKMLACGRVEKEFN